MEPTIHHITDLHVGPLHASAKQPSFLAREKNEVQSEAIVRYVKHLRKQETLPDLVVISGDLTSYASESEFGRIADFLDELGVILKRDGERDRPRICVVPGNHDLDWQAQSQEAKHERFRRLCQPRSAIVFSPFSDPPYMHYQDINMLVYAFNSCPMGGINDPELGAVTERFADVLGQLSRLPKDKELNQAVADLRRIGRQDPGYILEKDLEAMDKHVRPAYDRMFKIAVMHHNPSLVPSNDTDQFQSIVNGGIVKHRLMKAGFDLVLHGHRHFPHCSYEEYFEDKSIRGAKAARYAHGLHTLGGPSLGSPTGDACWFSISIDKPIHVYEQFPPASLVTVHTAIKDAADYQLRGDASYQMPIGKKVRSDFQALQELIGRIPPQEPRTMELRKSIDSIQLGLLDLQAKVDDWESDDSNWQDAFHSDLASFGFVYGIDLLGPASWFNPSYLEYITQQFAERQRRLEPVDGGITWQFSPEVWGAVTRTSWGAPGGAPRERPRNSRELEIARILIWKKVWLKETAILKMIDSLHKLFGVPVFVLEAELAREFTQEEFVIALDRHKNPLQCRTYNTLKGGKTRAVPRGDRQRYLDQFNKLLERADLVSIVKLISA